jgi:predicted RNA-binding protein with PIN domain
MSSRPHFIIDGYNYILRHFYIDMSEEHALWDAREQLIHQMIAYLGQQQIRITIVFDGQDLKGITKIQRPAGISVRFSKAPVKADPVIINLVQKSKTPKNITVVTSDNGLAAVCQSYGSEILSSEAFLDKIERERHKQNVVQKYEHDMTPSELKEWLRLFGEDA